MKPIVAIVGRPNVGKSTFFNRVTRTRDALVDNMPGVTRDRHYGNAVWDDAEFTIVDTGGFSDKDDAGFSQSIRFQVRQAIADADVIVLLMDGKSGISPFDREILEILRRTDKAVFYAVNKIDGAEQESDLYDFYSLGLEKLYPVSAEHRYGLTDFLDDLILSFPESVVETEQDLIRLSVVGRPNVGKSSLINWILGKQRLLVSDIPGTTRDAIDSVCQVNGTPYMLIDTAGIRRKSKVTAKLEKFSIIKALRSLDRCDVALIVIDAEQGITEQDITVAGYAHDRGCGCIFLLNKWDAIGKDTRTASRYIENLRSAAKFLSFAPVLTISALTGLRVQRIFPLVEEVFGQYTQRMGTGLLNRIITNAVEKNEPSLHKGKRLKFYYTTQTGSKPPTFVFFVNYPEAVHFSYKRYLTNRLREDSGLDKTPVRLIFKQRSGRMVFEGKKPRKKDRRNRKAHRGKKGR